MKLKKLKSFVKTFQDDIQARDIAYNKVNNSYEEAKEEIKHLKADVAKNKAGFDEKMAENIQLNRSLVDLKTECEKYKKANSDSTLELSKLNANLKKLTTQLMQKQEEINKYTQNGKVMEQNMKDHTSYIEKLNEAKDRMYAENSHLKTLHDHYVKENAQLWEQNKALKSQLNEANGIIEGANADLQMHKEQLDSLIPDNESLNRALNDIKSKLVDTMDTNKKIVEEGEVWKAQQNIKLQSALEENKKLKDEIASLKVENEKTKAEFNAILEDIKARNEERRKRKRDKLKRCEEEIKQKKLGKNMTYSSMSATKDIPPSINPYVTKTRVEPAPINPPPKYYPSSQTRVQSGTKNVVTQPLTEVKSFIEEDDEEVSVAFEELMTEIAKYEGSDKQTKN